MADYNGHSVTGAGIGALVVGGLAAIGAWLIGKTSKGSSGSLQKGIAGMLGGKASRAVRAQEVLEQVGIDRESDPRNLIWLKKSVHRRLHTKVYYGWVDDVVVSAYESAGKNKQRQIANVNAALLFLRNELDRMNNIFPE